VLVGLGLAAAALLLAFLLAQLKLRATQMQPMPVLGQIADFTLTNQLGHPVTLGSLRGHPWVVDVIFTRCAGPCLKMSKQMMELQRALPPNSQARLVTLTTDPEYDTPSILKIYSERFQADTNRWMFLTGPKPAIQAVIRDSLKLTAVEKGPKERDTPVDLFIHSTIFVLADKKGQLRGIYETTGEGVDPSQVQQQLLAGLRRLERER
jgi:cytochrome oxidase Cu insertion factor (SCO1/SenC/PrrC family)